MKPHELITRQDYHATTKTTVTLESVCPALAKGKGALIKTE